MRPRVGQGVARAVMNAFPVQGDCSYRVFLADCARGSTLGRGQTGRTQVRNRACKRATPKLSPLSGQATTSNLRLK